MMNELNIAYADTILASKGLLGAAYFGVPKLPAPYDTFEWAIVSSFFLVHLLFEDRTLPRVLRCAIDVRPFPETMRLGRRLHSGMCSLISFGTGARKRRGRGLPPAMATRSGGMV
jgi:hypothetical protein